MIKNTICKIVNQITKYSKGDIKIIQEYNPKRQGYLTVGDKYICENGEKKLILIATDSRENIIHLEIFNQAEQNKILTYFFILFINI